MVNDGSPSKSPKKGRVDIPLTALVTTKLQNAIKRQQKINKHKNNRLLDMIRAAHQFGNEEDEDDKEEVKLNAQVAKKVEEQIKQKFSES